MPILKHTKERERDSEKNPIHFSNDANRKKGEKWTNENKNTQIVICFRSFHQGCNLIRSSVLLFTRFSFLFISFLPCFVVVVRVFTVICKRLSIHWAKHHCESSVPSNWDMSTAWNQVWCRWYPFGEKWIKHLSLVAVDNRILTSAEVK